MRVLCLCLISLVVAVNALDLYESASWDETAFAFAADGLAVTGADIAGNTIAIRPQPGAFKSKAHQLFSGGNDKVRLFDESSTTWLKSLYDKVITVAATTVVDGTASVVGNPAISMCQLWHMHTMRKTGTKELVLIIHVRENCKLTDTEYNTCKTAIDKGTCDSVKDNQKAMADNEKCSCVGGFDKHLFVYSSADAKLYYFKTFQHMAAAAKKVGSNMAALAAGGWYKEVLADSIKANYELITGGDININPDDNKIYLSVNIPAKDNLIALYTRAPAQRLRMRFEELPSNHLQPEQN